MTLLEALVALVILSVVGIGCLELTHASAELETSSVAWNEAVSEAESRMAVTVLQAPDGAADKAPAGERETIVARQAWKHGLDDITVTVTRANGVSFTLHRLVPSARSAR